MCECLSSTVCRRHVRTQMGLLPADAMDSIQLPAHAGAEVKCADQLTTMGLQALEEMQPGALAQGSSRGAAIAWLGCFGGLRRIRLLLAPALAPTGGP